MFLLLGSYLWYMNRSNDPSYQYYSRVYYEQGRIGRSVGAAFMLPKAVPLLVGEGSIKAAPTRHLPSRVIVWG
jgi:hypothetical protein